MEKPRGEALMSSAQLYQATGYGQSGIAEMVATGVIKQKARNQWPTITTLGAIVRRLREKNAGDADRQRKNKAEADEAEARAMETLGQTCLKKEAKLFWGEERTKIRVIVERAEFLTLQQKAKLLARFADIKTGKIGEL